MEQLDPLIHVTWEMETLAEEFDYFLESDENAKGERARRRPLELTLLHARNLDEFFTGGGKDRMKCAEFGFRRRPKDSLLSKDDRDRINWRLSHLTKKRTNP